MNVIGTIYSWAVSLGFYSPNLDSFLLSSSEGMNYVIVFIISLFITLLVLAIYYLFPDRPNWAKARYWFVALIINALFTFLFSSQTVLQNQMDGLTRTINPTTNQPEQLVSEMDCWMFGLSDSLLFIVIFVILSYVIRLKSTNNRFMPFK
jgi:uncharacterized membrane protein